MNLYFVKYSLCSNKIYSLCPILFVYLRKSTSLKGHHLMHCLSNKKKYVSKTTSPKRSSKHNRISKTIDFTIKQGHIQKVIQFMLNDFQTGHISRHPKMKYRTFRQIVWEEGVLNFPNSLTYRKRGKNIKEFYNYLNMHT
jgi:hypothetical protein